MDVIITSQRGKGTKIHIFVDGEYTITTDATFFYGLNLSNGDTLRHNEWQELCDQIHTHNAIVKAVDAVSRRDYSQKELERKLTQKFPFFAAKAAVEKMVQTGYINDESYCTRLLQQLLYSKKVSLQKAKLELLAKGIDRDLVQAAIDDIEIDPVDQISALLQSKYVLKMRTEKGRQQTFAAMQRRGFSYSDIRTAFNREAAGIEDWD